MDDFKLVGRKNTGDYKYWLEFDEKYYPIFIKENLFTAPFWYVGAYFLNHKEDEACMIGAELKYGNVPDGMDVEIIPATTWVVFTFIFRPGENAAGETYAKAITEWLPASNYVRNENAPFLEVYGHSANQFEVWIPVVSK